MIREAKKQNPGKEIKVLNLFAYTGGATVACADAGAKSDSCGRIQRDGYPAKENAALSRLANAPIRYLVDDCVKFVEREIRRGNHYDAIIMDPPSYGRGPKGEIWKIEEKIFPLVQLCTKVLADKPLFFLINSYTTGLQPAVLSYMLNLEIKSRFGGTVEADEIGLPVRGKRGLVLPCGASGRWNCKERVRGRGEAMKLIHCADLHLDSSMTTHLTKEKAKERKAELLASFNRMMEYADRENVSAVLIAGDLFDRKNISATARNAVYHAISTRPEMTFYYLKGNHDVRLFLPNGKRVPGKFKIVW